MAGEYNATITFNIKKGDQNFMDSNLAYSNMSYDDIVELEQAVTNFAQILTNLGKERSKANGKGGK
jgi:hypothetical protein